MGRWSQRHRSGGGKSINFITAAVAFDESTVRLTYLDALLTTSVTEADYLLDAAFVPNNMSQVDTNVIDLNMGDPVDVGQLLLYSGDTPGVLSPQSINLVAP